MQPVVDEHGTTTRFRGLAELGFALMVYYSVTPFWALPMPKSIERRSLGIYNSEKASSWLAQDFVPISSMIIESGKLQTVSSQHPTC